MKDTMRMKSISNADIEKSKTQNKKKCSGFGTFINVFGMVLLIIMLTIVGVNFSRDARIFEKPLLTSDTAKQKSNEGNSDAAGTIKYKKSNSKTTASSEKTSETTEDQTTVTPTPTPDP